MSKISTIICAILLGLPLPLFVYHHHHHPFKSKNFGLFKLYNIHLFLGHPTSVLPLGLCSKVIFGIVTQPFLVNVIPVFPVSISICSYGDDI
jgi:hypothetical protein